jgi:hypothetical protein
MPLFRLPAGAVLLFACVLAAPTHAQPSEADASPIATTVPDSAATEVFVLGTTHLSGVADRFEPSMVDSLIAALNAFGPDAIAVENLPGRQVAAMERWGGSYERIRQRFADTFLYHGHQVQSQTGWTWGEANQRADSLLTVARSDAAALDPDGRLSLIRGLTAAYRFPSAVLQWRYLPADARTSQSTLPDTTAETLDQALTAANETYSIGMRLAHERGHQRLYPMDHQGEKDLILDIYRPLQKATDSMRTAFQEHPVFQRGDSLLQAGLESGSLLPLYRHKNSDERARAGVEMQWKAMLHARLPDELGRKRVALWETRNLHMVGQIQRMIAQHPGERVLVIVGSSHKPFFDAYLRQMMSVQVVDADTVLPSP